MSKSLIDAAAQKAGIGIGNPPCVPALGDFCSRYGLERFAQAIAEECAKLCDAAGPEMSETYGSGAECIRTAETIAERIRNML